MNSGKMVWSEKFNNKISTALSVVDDSLIMGLDNGDVVALRTNLINIVK
jgi:hypothetical protein